MSAPALQLRGVVAGYGGVQALHGVDLRLPAGRILALVGPNGAGKTTVLRVAAGLLAPRAGCVHLGGVHVNGRPPADLARAGLRVVPEGRGVFSNLTVEEHLRLVAGRRPWRDVVEEALTRFPQLAGRRRQPAGSMSGGEQQMLALARGLATGPAVLAVDELSMGLSPRAVEQLYEAITALTAEGVSVLLVEQLTAAALAVADHAVVLAGGRVLAAGSPEDVRPALPRAYLGEAA